MKPKSDSKSVPPKGQPSAPKPQSPGVPGTPTHNK
jgi:hypothetical protein